jgi:hypothetical protein
MVTHVIGGPVRVLSNCASIVLHLVVRNSNWSCWCSSSITVRFNDQWKWFDSSQRSSCHCKWKSHSDFHRRSSCEAKLCVMGRPCLTGRGSNSSTWVYTSAPKRVRKSRAWLDGNLLAGCLVVAWIILLVFITFACSYKNNSVACIPQANYTDRATAACW